MKTPTKTLPLLLGLWLLASLGFSQNREAFDRATRYTGPQVASTTQGPQPYNRYMPQTQAEAAQSINIGPVLAASYGQRVWLRTDLLMQDGPDGRPLYRALFEPMAATVLGYTALPDGSWRLSLKLDDGFVGHIHLRDANDLPLYLGLPQQTLALPAVRTAASEPCPCGRQHPC